MKKRKLTLDDRTIMINNSLDLGDINFIVDKYDYYFEDKLEGCINNEGRSFTVSNGRIATFGNKITIDDKIIDESASLGFFICDLLLTVNQKYIKLWNLDTLRCIKQKEIKYIINNIFVYENTIITTSYCEVTIWDLDLNILSITDKFFGINYLYVFSEGIMVGIGNGNVNVLDFNLKVIIRILSDNNVSYITYIQSIGVVVIYDNSYIKIFDLQWNLLNDFTLKRIFLVSSVLPDNTLLLDVCKYSMILNLETMTIRQTKMKLSNCKYDKNRVYSLYGNKIEIWR